MLSYVEWMLIVLKMYVHDMMVTPPILFAAPEDKCSLTRYPTCRRFGDDSVNQWLADLFFAIADASRGEVPIPKVGFTVLGYDWNLKEEN